MTMWKRFKGIALILAAVLMLLPALNTAHAADAKLKVVVTLNVYGDFLKIVGGDKLDITTLVGLDGDPHEYEPTPADSAKIVEAALVFENGIGLETWLPKLYEASGSKARRVVVTNTANVVAAEGALKEENDLDPHVWHDPENMIEAVKAVRGVLIQADPKNIDVYQKNADAYIKQIQALDTELKKLVETLPKAKRQLVTTHDAFGYFARHFGFTVVGTLIGLSTEAAEPSAADVAKLVEAVKKAGVKAIFAEVSNNADLINRVAKEAGVKLGPDLMADGLGKVGPTYLEMMRYNVTSIVNALK